MSAGRHVDMKGLNLLDLDVEELERRVEMTISVAGETVITADDGGCPELTDCGELKCYENCYIDF